MSNTNVVDFPLSPATISAALAKLSGAKLGGLDVAVVESGTFIMHNDKPVALVDRSTGSVKFEEAGTYGRQRRKFEVKAGETMDVVDLVGKTMPGYSRDRLLNEFRGTVEAVETDRAKRDETVNQGIRSGNITKARKQAKTNVRRAYLDRMAKLGREVAGVDSATGTAGSSWAPVDLTKFVDGTFTPPPATVGDRTDGVALFVPCKTYDLHADPGTGKSMVAQVLVTQELAKGNNVLYIDYEDSPESVIPRLAEMGTDPALFGQPGRFSYIQPVEHVTEGVDLFVDALTASEWSLIIVDGVNKSMQLAGVKTNESEDVNRWYDDIPRVCELTGAAVVMVDHTAKGSNGSTAMGSTTKGGALTGASIYVEESEPLVKGQRGVLNLIVFKDRGSHLRANGVQAKGGGFHFADVVIDSRTAGTIEATIMPPSASKDYTDPANNGGTGLALSGDGLAMSEYRTALSGAQRAYVAAVYAMPADAKTLTTNEVYEAWQYLWPGDLEAKAAKMNRELAKAADQGALTRRGNRYAPAAKWSPAKISDAKLAAFEAAIKAVSDLKK